MQLFNKWKTQAVDKIKDIATEEIHKDLSETLPVYATVAGALILVAVCLKHPNTIKHASKLREVSQITISIINNYK